MKDGDKCYGEKESSEGGWGVWWGVGNFRCRGQNRPFGEEGSGGKPTGGEQVSQCSLQQRLGIPESGLQPQTGFPQGHSWRASWEAAI